MGKKSEWSNFYLKKKKKKSANPELELIRSILSKEYIAFCWLSPLGSRGVLCYGIGCPEDPLACKAPTNSLSTISLKIASAFTP